jgi:COP9 signalosome complex subunit 5
VFSRAVFCLRTGKITGSTMIVVDAFALPVEGTETRVNAGAEAFEYMVQYMEDSKKVCKQQPRYRWLTTIL